MRAKSIKGKTVEEVRLCIEQSMSDGFRPTLAVVFTSEEDHREVISNHLTEKAIRVFGASSGANFIDSELQQEGTVLILIDMNPNYFLLAIKEGDETAEIAEHIGRDSLDQFKKPAFLIMSGGLSTDGDEIIEGIERACGKGTPIFGGLAADKLLMQRTYVFTNHQSTDKGLLALAVDQEKISLKGLAVGGWKPMGIDRVITKSKGNVVYTIDNETAVDFIKRYAGLKEFNRDSNFALVLSSNFQFQLNRKNKHPVMRAPMMANEEDGSLVFAATMPEGSRVKLSLLPTFEVVQEAVRQFQEFKNEQQDADALVLFSCAGRQLSLGPYVSDEIEGILNTWSAPLAGFFCFGEIGRVSGAEHEFHNMTCSLAILKEK